MRKKQTSKSKHAAPTSDLRETQARVQMDGILQRINRPTKVFLVSLGLVLLIGLALWGFISDEKYRSFKENICEM